jgi:hypothetical protein
LARIFQRWAWMNDRSASGIAFAGVTP